jgi:hypothetical protein
VYGLNGWVWWVYWRGMWVGCVIEVVVCVGWVDVWGGYVGVFGGCVG